MKTGAEAEVATADPDVVACDLRAQAEHGPTSPAHLVTDSAVPADALLESLETQLEGLPTKALTAEAWMRRGAIAVAANREEMVEYTEHFAPEHLEIDCEGSSCEELGLPYGVNSGVMPACSLSHRNRARTRSALALPGIERLSTSATSTAASAWCRTAWGRSVSGGSRA